MRYLILSILLTGCSLLPTPHDPALVTAWVQTSQDLQRVNCADRTSWSELQRSAEFLRGYAEFRADNQVKTAMGVQENIAKAHTATNQRVCEHNLTLARNRLDVLKSAWSGR